MNLKTVLLVDDDPIILSFLKKAIQSRNNLNIISTTDVEEALDIFFQQEISLVITDIMMPKISGVEFVNVIRKLDESVPIVVMSGTPSLFQSTRGGNEFIQKPIDPTKIVSITNRFIVNE